MKVNIVLYIYPLCEVWWPSTPWSWLGARGHAARWCDEKVTVFWLFAHTIRSPDENFFELGVRDLKAQQITQRWFSLTASFLVHLGCGIVILSKIILSYFSMIFIREFLRSGLQVFEPQRAPKITTVTNYLVTGVHGVRFKCFVTVFSRGSIWTLASPHPLHTQQAGSWLMNSLNMSLRDGPLRSNPVTSFHWCCSRTRCATLCSARFRRRRAMPVGTY